MSILVEPDIDNLTRSAKPYADARSKYKIVEGIFHGQLCYHILKRKRVFLIGPRIWIKYKQHPSHANEFLYNSPNYCSFSLFGVDLPYTLEGAKAEINRFILEDLGELKNGLIMNTVTDDGLINNVLY